MDKLQETHLYDRQPGLAHVQGYNWEISFAHEDKENSNES